METDHQSGFLQMGQGDVLDMRNQLFLVVMDDKLTHKGDNPNQ